MIRTVQEIQQAAVGWRWPLCSCMFEVRLWGFRQRYLEGIPQVEHWLWGPLSIEISVDIELQQAYFSTAYNKDYFAWGSNRAKAPRKGFEILFIWKSLEMGGHTGILLEISRCCLAQETRWGYRQVGTWLKEFFLLLTSSATPTDSRQRYTWGRAVGKKWGTKRHFVQLAFTSPTIDQSSWPTPVPHGSLGTWPLTWEWLLRTFPFNSLEDPLEEGVRGRGGKRQPDDGEPDPRLDLNSGPVAPWLRGQISQPFWPPCALKKEWYCT